MMRRLKRCSRASAVQLFNSSTFQFFNSSLLSAHVRAAEGEAGEGGEEVHELNVADVVMDADGAGVGRQAGEEHGPPEPCRAGTKSPEGGEQEDEAAGEKHAAERSSVVCDEWNQARVRGFQCL